MIKGRILENGKILTATEERIFRMLMDGEPHSVKEVKLCLNDELSSTQNLQKHIMRLRKKLPKNLGVYCTMSGPQGVAYVMTQKLYQSNPYTGNT